MFAKLDVAWRKGEPIDILVNPKGPRDVEALCAGQPWQSVRFQLNARGLLWFADANVSLHGDESRGRVIAQSIPTGLVNLVEGAPAPCLVYGFVSFPSWKVEVHDNDLDLAGVDGAARLLHQFKTWRRATNGVSYTMYPVSPSPKLHPALQEVVTAARLFKDDPSYKARLGVALGCFDKEFPS